MGKKRELSIVEMIALGAPGELLVDLGRTRNAALLAPSGQLVRPAYHREPVRSARATGQLTGWAQLRGFNGVAPDCGSQDGLLPLGQREAWDHKSATLGRERAGAIVQRGLERAAKLALARAVGAPGHHGFLEAAQHEVARTC